MSTQRIQNRPSGTGERLYRQLPREVIVRSSARSVLINVLCPFLAIFIINFAALWYLDRYTTNRGYWLVKQKWKILQTMPGPTEWLILGDSSGNQGIVPEKLGGELGGTAVNLCTTGGTALLDDVWMLEEYIERFGSPKNVLIVHTYDIWHRDIEPIVLAKVPLPWGYWNRFSPSPELSTEDQVNILLGRYVPLYAENITLGNILRQGVLSPQSLFKNPFHLEPDGHMRLMEADPQSVGQDTVWHVEFVRENRFSLSDINQASLDQIITLANRYRINVFIANGPVYEGLYDNKDFREYLSEVQRELHSFAERSEYVYYLATFSAFPSSQMQNTDHVIHSTAEKYTETLALEIMRVQ